jgi:hypothetical protein
MIKRGSQVVVPQDEELQTLLITEFHDSKYVGHFGMSRTRVAVGRMFWWNSLAGDVAKFVSTYRCSVSEKQGSSPQALWTATTVTCSGEALAYGDLQFYCQAS